MLAGPLPPRWLSLLLTAALFPMLAPQSSFASAACDVHLPNAYDLIADQDCGSEMTTGDFNGDGFPDLLTYCHVWEPFPEAAGQPIHLYLGSADGLVRGPDLPIPGTSIGPVIRVVDLNGDGKLDLIDGGAPPIVWHGHGDGTFDAPVPISGLPPAGVDAIWLTDLNGDGRMDLVSLVSLVFDGLFDHVRTFLADGAGGFQDGALLALPGETVRFDLGVADFNHDNHGDLAVVTGLEGDPQFKVSVYLGDGSGSFTGPTQLPVPSNTVPLYPTGVVDWNGDGNVDVLITGHGTEPSGVTSRFLLYRGQGDGTFLDPIFSDFPPPLAETDSPINFLVADWNGDSTPDLIYGLQGQLGFRVQFGTPSGPFGAHRDYPGLPFGSPPVQIQVSGDAAPDLAVLNRGNLLLYENQGGGVFDRVPTAALQTRIDNALVRAADLNGDGRTDFVLLRHSNPDTLLVDHVTGALGVSEAQAVGFDIPPPAAGNSPSTPSFRDYQLSDLTGDGIPELLVLHVLEATRGALYVCRGLQGGTFAQPFELLFPIEKGEIVFTVLTGDLNNDGKHDVLIVRTPDFPPFPVTNDRKAVVALALGNGDGTLAPPTDLFRSFGTLRTALADMNHDGNLDLLAFEAQDVVGGTTGPALTVRFGTGTGGFGPPTIRPVTWSGTYRDGRLRVADVNGDGHGDAVLTLEVGPSDLNRFQAQVFLGHDDGTFSDPVVTLADSISVTGSLVGDLNGDGRADMLVPGRTFCGQSDGTFAAGDRFTTLPGTLALFFTNLDGDNAKDVVAFAGPLFGNNDVLAFYRNLRTIGSTPIVARMTFEPPVIQPKSQGKWVHVTLQLDPGHDASAIDPSSLRIGDMGIAPKSAQLGDADGDGVTDLTVAFPRAPFQALSAGEHVVDLTGSLTTGEAFEAHATIRVLPTHGKDRLALRVLSALGSSPVVLGVSGARERERTVRVFDVRGRLLRSWNEAADADRPVIWDGRDAKGANAPSGIYFTRVVTRSGNATARTVLLR